MRTKKNTKDKMYDKLIDEFKKYENEFKMLYDGKDNDAIKYLSAIWGCKQILRNVFNKN